MLIAVSLGGGGGSAAGTPAGAATTVRWNPADKAAAAVLSNSDRTLTSSGASDGGARSVGSWATGKRYFELVVDAVTGNTNESAFGLATSATSLTALSSGGSFLQCAQASGSAGIGLFSSPRFAATITRAAPWYNATLNGTGLIGPTTSTLRIAADFDAGNVWFGIGAGWLGDPANGVAPAATWTGGSLTLFLWAVCYGNTNQFSIPLATAYAAPAGFAVA